MRRAAWLVASGSRQERLEAGEYYVLHTEMPSPRYLCYTRLHQTRRARSFISMRRHQRFRFYPARQPGCFCRGAPAGRGHGSLGSMAGGEGGKMDERHSASSAPLPQVSIRSITYNVGGMERSTVFLTVGRMESLGSLVGTIRTRKRVQRSALVPVNVHVCTTRWRCWRDIRQRTLAKRALNDVRMYVGA
jgi:hypothetical protein